MFADETPDNYLPIDSFTNMTHVDTDIISNIMSQGILTPVGCQCFIDSWIKQSTQSFAIDISTGCGMTTAMSIATGSLIDINVKCMQILIIEPTHTSVRNRYYCMVNILSSTSITIAMYASYLGTPSIEKPYVITNYPKTTIIGTEQIVIGTPHMLLHMLFNHVNFNKDSMRIPHPILQHSIRLNSQFVRHIIIMESNSLLDTSLNCSDGLTISIYDAINTIICKIKSYDCCRIMLFGHAMEYCIDICNFIKKYELMFFKFKNQRKFFCSEESLSFFEKFS